MSLIGACSICSFFGQVFTSRAYQLDTTSRIAATLYIQIAVAFIFDIVIFNAPLKWTDLLGSSLIIGVIMIVTILKGTGIIKDKQ